FEGTFGHLDLEIGDVGGQFQVDGEFSTPRCQNQPIDLSNGILRSNSRLGNRHLSEHTTEVPFFSIGESVVHQISTLNGSQWKGTRNQDHGNMLAVGTGDAVDGAESSDTVCHSQCADALDSCIRISRVGRVKLVTISNPGRFTPILQLLHEFEVVIARHTEDVPNPNLLQAAK